MTESKQVNQSSRDLIQVIEWFRENFSVAFPRNAAEVKPLQLGIIDEILEFYSRLDTPPFSKKRIRAALGYYTLSPVYLKAQHAGAARIDLYGNEVETVTAEQAAYAQQKFQLRYGKKPAAKSELPHHEK